jgi:uncharacterized membrane protein YqhA
MITHVQPEPAEKIVIPAEARPDLGIECEIESARLKARFGYARAPFEYDNLRRIRARLEQVFEKTLWASRLIVLVAVIASLVVGVAMFFVATVDTVGHIRSMGTYLSSFVRADQHEAMRTEIVTQVVEAIDGYLLGIVMIIFSFGLYELFISRIDPAEASDRSPRILLINSLDDLKHRLAQVVLLILVVKFFERALSIPFTGPIDLVYFSVGILLIAAALYLSYLGGGAHDGNKVPTKPVAVIQR